MPSLDERLCRVHFRPQRSWILVAAMLAVLLLASFNYNNNPGLFVTFLLLNTVALAPWYAWRNSRPMQIRAHAMTPVFAGEPVQWRIWIANPDSYPRFFLWVGFSGEQATCLSLPPLSERCCTLQIQNAQRGWSALPELTISSVFPFGLLRCSRRYRLNTQTLVFPQPRVWEWRESLLCAPAADQEDMSGLRAYRAGDTPGRMVWKKALPNQPPPSKSFEHDTGDDSVVLDWDNTQGGIEQRLSALCYAALQAERLGLHYGLKLPHASEEAGRGDFHLYRLLEKLALYA